MASILSVKGVYKVFKLRSENIMVLNNINLEVEKGKFVVLFGPSGCGKSTLLNLILGLDTISKGHISFMGKSVEDMKQDELAELRKNDVGIIYQQPNWLKALTVEENVAFPLMVQGWDKNDAIEEARKILTVVKMINWKNYSPLDLSAGQQQKIALARALITQPKILVADEPAGNLDYKSSSDLMKLFSELVNDGMTIILVTHNLVNLESADQIVRMLDGRIIDTVDAKKMSSDKKELILSATESAGLMPVPENFMFESTEWGKGPSIVTSLLNFLLFPLSILKIVLLLLIYSIYKFFSIIETILTRKPRGISALFNNMSKVVDFLPAKTISFNDLISISLRNLLRRKMRAIITIGGVAVGVSFTVLLFSLGFGLENVVVSRVANFDELNQIGVLPLPSSNIFLSTEMVDSLKRIQNVKAVLPVVGIAGKITYEGSSADVVVKGVTADYIPQTKLKITAGTNLPSVANVSSFINFETLLPKDDVSTRKRVTNEVQVAIPQPSRTIVVNESVLRLFNLTRENALGKKIKVSFILTNGVLGNNYKVTSTEAEYEIVGVVSFKEEKILYVPVSDLVPLGVQRYSDATIVANDSEKVGNIRVATEALGFRTLSIQDTIAQINVVFYNIRLIFGGVGLVALFIASLGMFNTLTVSLLERVREVGLMKAIGMKTTEVKKLFLAESSVMGFLGGILGIGMGVLLGYATSWVISALYISRGGEYVNITVFPVEAGIAIIILSVFVGFLTGFYPAVRAMKMAPLEALKYE